MRNCLSKIMFQIFPEDCIEEDETKKPTDKALDYNAMNPLPRLG